MKFQLLTTLLFLSSTFAVEENCIEQPDPCSTVTEYNAYINCLEENKRQKRSIGCPLLAQAESCEYVDCQSCQESCLPDCPDCECPSSCRQCCSETCATNLCCHKTCHNQCKTNYCRTECKKECKDMINQRTDMTFGGMDTNIGVNVNENNSLSNQAKHNITTIINLHNIINNTNLIDIPIKINNTNFNNITLKRTDHSQFSMKGQYGYGQGQQQEQEQETDEETGEKCCYVVSPRQCVKTNYHPFMRCFHYRHKKCGPFCIATIVHAQNQNYCDDSGCHNKLFYIPQVQQPKCYYTPSYPFINCGGGHQTFHNCQGCYDHISSGTSTAQTGIHHHMRCSKCYDNGSGSNIQPGAMYQPPMMSGYPMGYPMGYLAMMPPPVPMYQPYAAYGQPGMNGQQMYGPQMAGQPMMGQPMMGQQMMGQQMMGQQMMGQQFYGQDQQLPPGIDNEIIDSSENSKEINYKYPVGSVGQYVFEKVINADMKSGTPNDQINKTNLPEDSGVVGSRYALISIDAAKPSQHDKREDKKEKKYRRKKDKLEQTTEKRDEKSAEQKSTTEKK